MDARHFALIITLAAAVGLVAVLANRLTQRLKVPVPLLMLTAAAVAVKVIPSWHAPPVATVEDILTIALMSILFDGGMGIGARRFKRSAGPIVLVGVVGTFFTAAGGAAVLHFVFGIDWYLALLTATAIAPTDPAVVFSVLGQREIAGRSGTVLEGESGANDPVGIALMSALIAAGSLSVGAFGQVAAQFLLQMLVGGLLGLVGGRTMLSFIRRVSLPSEGLYPIRTLACVALLYGVATLAHGSGFLAVFVAGIVLGDERAPFKREIERFHSALAAIAEIVAFIVLGLTVDLNRLIQSDVWVPGLVLAVVLSFAVRPVVVGLCLIPARLKSNEAAFVLFAGLKGAVPLLLGELMLAAGTQDADRLYAIVVVVVVFSVLVQGSLTPTVAQLLKLRMRQITPEPWAIGVRLADEPPGVHRYVVGAGSPAEGRVVSDLTELPEDSWITFLVRAHQPVPVRATTQLQVGDEVLVLGNEECADELQVIFDSDSAAPSGRVTD
ncbi:MAG: cation:proton antiporter [Acidimicrobiales bacterium]